MQEGCAEHFFATGRLSGAAGCGQGRMAAAPWLVFILSVGVACYFRWLKWMFFFFFLFFLFFSGFKGNRLRDWKLVSFFAGGLSK